MFRNDFIVRLIEEWGLIWRQIILMLRGERFDDALKLIDLTMQRFFGFDSRFIDLMAGEQLSTFLSIDGVLQRERCLVLARMLKAEGDVYAAQNNDTASDRRLVKALWLYATLAADQPDRTAYEDEAHQLAEQLQQHESRAGLIALLRWYEVSGMYGRAEDALFSLIDEYPDDLPLIDSGIAFYMRLQALDDLTLHAGGLPRHEVAEGLATLQHLKHELFET